MELEQPFIAPNIGAIEEKEKQLLRELQIKYGDQSGALANSRTSSVILGLPKGKKRNEKAESKKEGTLVGGTKSVVSRDGKHKEEKCPHCSHTGRSDNIKRHIERKH